jgi:hypothetical protein
MISAQQVVQRKLLEVITLSEEVGRLRLIEGMTLSEEVGRDHSCSRL